MRQRALKSTEAVFQYVCGFGVYFSLYLLPYKLELLVANEYLPTKKKPVSEIDDNSPERQVNKSPLTRMQHGGGWGASL